MSKLKIILLIFILPVTLFGLIHSNFAEEAVKDDNNENSKISTKVQEEIEEISSFKWTETLRLKDFLLTSNFIEIKNKINNTLEILRKNYEENPTVLGAVIDYGFFLIDLGEIDKAEQVWNETLKVVKLNLTPRVYKAWVSAYKENYLQAKDLWQPIVRESLENAGRFVIWLPHQLDAALGLYLIKNNLPDSDKTEAEKLVNSLVSRFATNPKLGSILITNDLQAGEIKSARKKIKKILDRFPDDTTTTTLLGIAELIDRNYEEALKHFDKVNELNPFSPTNHLMRGRTLLALKNKKEGLLEIDKAIELDPIWKNKKLKRKHLINQKNYLISTKAKDTFVPGKL